MEKQEIITDVWQLENNNQEIASDDMNMLYEQAKNGSVSARNIIKKCYNWDNWQEIKEKMETEGSVWYVWYMDGINNFIRLKNNLPLLD